MRCALWHRRKLPSRCSWRWTNSAPPSLLWPEASSPTSTPLCRGRLRTRPESSSWLTPARALSATWATEPWRRLPERHQSRSGRLRAQSSPRRDLGPGRRRPQRTHRKRYGWVAGSRPPYCEGTPHRRLDRSGIQEQRDRVTTWHHRTGDQELPAQRLRQNRGVGSAGTGTVHDPSPHLERSCRRDRRQQSAAGWRRRHVVRSIFPGAKGLREGRPFDRCDDLLLLQVAGSTCSEFGTTLFEILPGHDCRIPHAHRHEGLYFFFPTGLKRND